MGAENMRVKLPHLIRAVRRAPLRLHLDSKLAPLILLGRLMATGILDGVPVKYVSVSREELRGVIKGSGYLCSCKLCDHSKALNAYEFERHAGRKTKHPNNHRYFESGRTIYQIVQELRSTP
uniref:Tify domain-containing protein n=1 Tax=Tanacetum cinerariifolium TaxID=118510 RepID=A0A699J1L7_TANCI|nr:hypothetical protein [Tanacetum cinerariifolium]